MKTPLQSRTSFVLFLILLAQTAILPTLAAQTAAPAAGPFATTAKVEVKAKGKVVPLKREEQIAFMFVTAIHDLQDNCLRSAAEPCTIAALVRGPKPKDDFGAGQLKFDPNKTDPNYTYKVIPARATAEGRSWEIWATPKKPGLIAFYARSAGFKKGIFYNASGPASAESIEIEESSVAGDLFYTF